MPDLYVHLPADRPSPARQRAALPLLVAAGLLVVAASMPWAGELAVRAAYERNGTAYAATVAVWWEAHPTLLRDVPVAGAALVVIAAGLALAVSPFLPWAAGDDLAMLPGGPGAIPGWAVLGRTAIVLVLAGAAIVASAAPDLPRALGLAGAVAALAVALDDVTPDVPLLELRPGAGVVLAAAAVIVALGALSRRPARGTV